jgi:hypothetical protein
MLDKADQFLRAPFGIFDRGFGGSGTCSECYSLRSWLGEIVGWHLGKLVLLGGGLHTDQDGERRIVLRIKILELACICRIKWGARRF